MYANIKTAFELYLEIRTEDDADSMPVACLDITDDLSPLVAEAFMRGVLADVLPPVPQNVRATIEPSWLDKVGEPFVSSFEVELFVDGHDAPWIITCDSGRWARNTKPLVEKLRAEGTLPADRTVYRNIVARDCTSRSWRGPALAAPVVQDHTLESLGIRDLGDGDFIPDRPIVVNSFLKNEILERTVAAGVVETGGVVIGRLVRLPEPLPGTTTRYLTVLSSSVCDGRHVGSPTEFSFNGEAMAEAAQIAAVSGAQVMTVWHAHGWGTGCGNCNHKETCMLTEAKELSLKDYDVAEALFPHAATLLPVTGRELGANGDGPVLCIHGWRGGALRPHRYRLYTD